MGNLESELGKFAEQYPELQQLHDEIGKKTEQARESQEDLGPFRMKLELSHSVISNNRNCINCHTDSSGEYQTRISLIESIKKLDESWEVLKKQEKAEREKEIRDFIKNFETKEYDPIQFFNYCKCTPNEMEAMSYFANHCPGFSKENLIKHLRSIKPNQEDLLSRVNFSDAQFASVAVYLKRYLDKAGQPKLDDLCDEDKSELDFSESTYKATREALRYSPLGHINMALQYFGGQKIDSRLKKITKMRQLPDDKLAKVQNEQIYNPAIDKNEKIGQHIARVHMSEGPYPKPLIILFLGNMQTLSDPEKGMNQVFENLKARRLNADIIVFRAGNAIDEVCTNSSVGGNVDEHTEIQKAKRHNMIHAAMRGRGIFRNKKYTEIRSVGYSFGGGAQYESQQESGLYNGVPIVESIAVDPIRLGSDNLARPQSLRPNLSARHSQYFQVADYGIQSGPLADGRENDRCYKVPASLGLSATNGHGDVDRLPETVATITERMSQGVEVIPFESA